MADTLLHRLIVVMLGRLRMDVNECIQQYLVLCNRIFRPHKHIRHYSTQKFESAINEVISKYCKCHAQGCLHPHTHYLRQYDYLEFDEIDPDDPEQARRINGTCKVYVVILFIPLSDLPLPPLEASHEPLRHKLTCINPAPS